MGPPSHKKWLLGCLGAVAGFPGPEYARPLLHFTPSVVSDHGGWHDIAGAFTHKSRHHIWQGQGWNHAVSGDFVTWRVGAHGPAAIEETYAGMQSKCDPCSGYVFRDDETGSICAGFRQCESSQGVEGMHPWDVPLESRCALDDDLESWSEKPHYLFNVSWYRALPYDPTRPWREDGYWYLLLSMDGCNATTTQQKLPCAAGGQLGLWRSNHTMNSASSWEHVGAVFTSNATVLAGYGFLEKEFVTIEYVGNVAGDPLGGRSRVFFDNVGGNGGGVGCCAGTTTYRTFRPTPPGASWGEPVHLGMVDWGAFRLRAKKQEGAVGVDLLDGSASRGFSMARTLGRDDAADYVSEAGRTVMIGWTGEGPGSAMSLPRELSLAADLSLRQRFVPELQTLRAAELFAGGNNSTGVIDAKMLHVEVLAHFDEDACAATTCTLRLLVDPTNHTSCVSVAIDTERQLLAVDATALGNSDVRYAPLPDAQSSRGYTVHVYVDHAILTLIVNNQTALTVYVHPTNKSTALAVSPTNATLLRAWALNPPTHNYTAPSPAVSEYYYYPS